jgi:hypothetical protein
MYTVKDIVSNKFSLLSEFDIVNIEDVKSVQLVAIFEKRKKVTINISFYDFLFNSNYKKILLEKVNQDLGGRVDVKFGVGF